MITVRHTLHDLQRDLEQIPVRAAEELPRVVENAAEDGNNIAKDLAKESAGAHGKHYHKAFSVEQIGHLEYEYGPDSAMPQGGMSFEGGSRNQPPHNDLAQSADIVIVDLVERVRETVSRWFW